MEIKEQDKNITLSKTGITEEQEKPSSHTKTQRIFAWIGIGLLLAMYLVNLVFAFIDGEVARKMLLCSSVLTVLIPIILYFLVLMIKKKNQK